MEEHLKSAERDLLQSLSFMMYFARQVRKQTSSLIHISGDLRKPTPRIDGGLDAYNALDTHSHTLEMLGQAIAKDTSTYKDDPEHFKELLENWDYGEGSTLFETLELMMKYIRQAKQHSWDVYYIGRQLNAHSRSFWGILDWKLTELLYFGNELASVKKGKGFAGALRRAKFLLCLPPFSHKLSPSKRELILWRDKNRCFLCSDSSDLHVHHINRDRQDNRADNLVTVCLLCHKDLHEQTYRGKPSKRSGCDEVELRRRVQHCYYEGRGRYQLELAVS